jgi:hypothetical protein
MSDGETLDAGWCATPEYVAYAVLRWGSLRHVSSGLARACGWFWKPKPIAQVTAAWDPGGVTWHEVRR